MSFADSAEPCPHCWDDGAVQKATLSSKVFKDECMYCFTTNDEGTYVCMKCFHGMCAAHLQYHDHTGHTLFLQVKKLPKPERKTEEITSLAQLGVEPPDEFETAVVCRPCGQKFVGAPGATEECVKSINGALSPQLQSALADQQSRENSWLKPCPHCDTMVQAVDRQFTPQNPPKGGEPCANCDHRQNNWMCLTCGAIGCPREEAGGKQHAILHYMMTGHPVVLKTGTVTPAGADLHCYACDDEVRDAKLKEHLAHFGINMDTAVKSAKSMAELQLDQTNKFDFGKLTEAGLDLVPRYGPGHTGLKNLGNSCYMNSVLQAVFTIPEFRARFYEAEGALTHQQSCKQNPAECYPCQMQKLAQGYFSGDHSSKDLPEYRKGITPRDFKTFITKGHKDFSTGEQQDAEEFLRYILQTFSRKEMALSSNPSLSQDPSKMFDFLLEERTQCNKCHKVKYRRTLNATLSFAIPIDPPEDPSKVSDENRPKTTIDDCLSAMVQPALMECKCGACGDAAIYETTTRVATFPEVFAMHPRREYFDRKTLTTRKMDVFVKAPETIELERIRGHGLQSGEAEMPYEGSAPAAATGGSSGIEVDEMAFAQVISMGIEDATAKWALQNTNNDVERAVDWVFSHPEGPPSSKPSEPAPAAKKPEDPSVATNGNPKYELFGMVSHIGNSALSGHYIAHVKREGKWSICNDEKVAFSQDPPFSMASIYFYRRVQ